MAIRFSIVVPIYNVEKYLTQCLDSVLAQTHPDWEAILVNDGSTDTSPQIAHAYTQKDSRFKLVSQANQGLSAARNAGITNASGAYVVFLDSDDYIVPDALERIGQSVAPLYPDLIHADYIQFEEGSEKVIPHRHCDIPESTPLSGCSYFARFPFFPLIACVNIYRREFLLAHRFEFVVGLLFEDCEWIPKILAAAETVVRLDYPFYCYRLRPNSITTQKITVGHAQSYLRIIDELLKRRDSAGEQAQILYANYIWRIIFVIAGTSLYDPLIHKNDWKKIKSAMRRTPLDGLRRNTRIGAFILRRFGIHAFRLACHLAALSTPHLKDNP